MTYRGAKDGQTVYVKYSTAFDTGYHEVIFRGYYKDYKFLQAPNMATVIRDGLPFSVQIKDLYKNAPTVKG